MSAHIISRVSAVVFLLSLSMNAHAAVYKLEAVKIDLPDNWEVKTEFMGLSLFARPTQAADAEGWAQDQVAVSQQPHSGKRKAGDKRILDDMVKAKIAQIGHHASEFKVLGQSQVQVGGKTGKKIELRYKEGMRFIQAWCVVIPKGDTAFTSVMMISSPERFDSVKPTYEKIIRQLPDNPQRPSDR